MRENVPSMQVSGVITCRARGIWNERTSLLKGFAGTLRSVYHLRR